jgi:hypothetical protein
MKNKINAKETWWSETIKVLTSGHIVADVLENGQKVVKTSECVCMLETLLTVKELKCG